MSMTLILWKGPVVREVEEAEALLKSYYDRETKARSRRVRTSWPPEKS